MNTKMNKLALAIGALVMSGGAMAANTFDVSASIAADCVVSTTQAMAFTGLDMLTSSAGQSEEDTTATAKFDAICTNGTDAPTFSFASTKGVTAFEMTNPDDVAIAYTLHQGSTGAGSNITHGAATVFNNFSADGTAQELSVTGKVIPSAKNTKPVGTYGDIVTITAAFTAPAP